MSSYIMGNVVSCFMFFFLKQAIGVALLFYNTAGLDPLIPRHSAYITHNAS